MCFVDDTKGHNFDTYLSDCRQNASAPNETAWILVSVALEDKDQNLETLKNVSVNESLSNTQAMILMSERYPRPLDSAQVNEIKKFSYPDILAISNPDYHKDQLIPFSWNY